jgi:virulence factor Mce-like protein
MSPLIRRHQAGGRRRGMPALAIALIAILIPVFITYYAFHKRLPFTSQYTDYALVPNSVNVRSGSPVRIAGIDVGAVEHVEPAGRYTKIAFSVGDNGLPIHTDATLAVRDRLFLEGGYYVQLSPGSPSAPVAPEGFTIQPQNTQTPVQFFQLLSTFDVAARANLEQLLNTANTAFSPKPGQPSSQSGAGGFKQAIPQLVPVLKDTAWVSQALTGTHAGDVQNFLASTSNVMQTLAQNREHLGNLVTGLNAVSTALEASDGALAASVAGLDQTLRAAPPALTAIDRSLPSLARLASALTPALRQSPPILASLNSTLDQLLAAVKPSQRGRLITALNTTLTAFPSTLKQIGLLFRSTRPVTDCLNTHVIPGLQAQVNDGSLSTHEPVYKDFVHFLPSLAGASANFDANGPYIRVLSGTGTNSLLLGSLTNLPIIGQLVGISPGGQTLQGVSPKWIGDLTPADFRPDVECTTQALPNFSAASDAQPDLRKAASAANAFHPSVARVRQILRRITAVSKGSGQ